MSLDFRLDDVLIHNGEVLDRYLMKANPDFQFYSDGRLYTIIIYTATNGNPYVYYLLVNASPYSSGRVLLPYQEPMDEHARYIVEVYRQNGEIRPNVKDRHFYLEDPNLTLVQEFSYTFDPLDQDDSKYCRCVLDVAAKQPESCNTDRAWFHKRDGETCVNPYAVCHSSVKGESGRPSCGANYDYESLTDNELRGYASLNKINIPQPYSRSRLLNAIYEKKKREHD